LANKNLVVDAILKEIEFRKEYLQNETIKTIYFGGGTPSILPITDIEKIIDKISNSFTVESDAEITMEANPDDLNEQKLKGLWATKINRLSIGVQSFSNKDLVWMNRAHNTKQVYECLTQAQAVGFKNISIDLIYGLPYLSLLEWEDNLLKAISSNVQHISAYCLTIEPKTALNKLVNNGKVKAPSDNETIAQFKTLQKVLSKNGFEQYEVSSFCKLGFESKHNSSYWSGEKYIGIGPSAHSYNGSSRQWNVSNNSIYIKKTVANDISFEIESIDSKKAYNEYLLTRLRTKWGIDKNHIVTKYHIDIDINFNKEIKKYADLGQIEITNKIIKLTPKGMLMADRIASDFFIV
jgi:oxygen-independent coproporphyrinogen III oxidase